MFKKTLASKHLFAYSKLIQNNFINEPLHIPGAQRNFSFQEYINPFYSLFHENKRYLEYSNSIKQYIPRVHFSSQILKFPGAHVPFTKELKFIPECSSSPIPCFRILDDTGKPLDESKDNMDPELALKMYRNMVILQAMDTVFFEAQRQGRISFYLTTAGEEALNIASAAAISEDDHIFAQYREPGILLWRGFSLQDFANQCVGNADDYTKGRQMPVHYGSSTHKYQTISSPLATQIPHAVGAAYGLKMANESVCTVAFFGEGAASEGDFHAAVNFAAVLETPVLFVCRNNGWAISTPSKEQYKGDAIAGRGQAYGVRSIRVDGNDTLAMYNVIKQARKMAVEEGRPILIEALTYRLGHHSTSDDSSRYRASSEIDHWKSQRDPVLRFCRYLQHRSLWDESSDVELRMHARKEVIKALERAEKTKKPPLSSLFTDVYDVLPPNLIEQERNVREIVKKFPENYSPDVLMD